MKLKVGDKVKIREYLKENTSYGGLWVADHMEKYFGKIGTITEMFDDNNFRIDISGMSCWWNKNMVEHLTFPRMMEVSVYDNFFRFFEREVIFYEPRSIYPYITIDDDGYISAFKYAREIQKYEPKKDQDKLKEKVMALVDEIIELIKK